MNGLMLSYKGWPAARKFILRMSLALALGASLSGCAVGPKYNRPTVTLQPFEATVQRSRPVILTALAAVLAFIPLTFSVFWGSMAYTLIGGTAVGTVLTLVFLPALYSIWFGVLPTAVPSDESEAALVRS